MKKLNITTKHIAAILLIGCLSSCDDFFEAPSKSSLDESVIFSTVGLARDAVDGIKIPFAETNSYRGRYLPWYGMNTDVEWFNSSQTDGPNADLCVYNAQANNANMNTVNSSTGAPDNAFAMMYQGIERANLCIRGLRKYGNPQPGTEMGQLLAEAITLRAVYYADLVKAWGNVPARFEPINGETLYLPRTDRDVIYNQLIEDLAEAATLAPWPNESPSTTTVERVNKAFVKGLRARIALVAAGYSQHADGIRKGSLPDFSENELYAIALQECKDVIESGTARLEPSFEQLWKKYNQDNVMAGGESLWEIPFADGRGRMLFTFAVRHNNNDQYHANGANRGGAAGPLPHIFYDYDSKDTRRDVTCVPYRYGDPVPGPGGFAKQELVGLNTWYFGKYRYEWMSRKVTSSNDDGVNKMYMRFAEVLLMAAEAANELNDLGAAKNYLKEIRKRAFPSSEHAAKVDAYIDAIGGKETMFNAIVEEHKFEFCGEMERKQALIRWNLLTVKLNEAKAKLYALRAREGQYADVPEKVYYKYAANGETLMLHGFNRGETDNPGDGYTEWKTDTGGAWIRTGAINDLKIESIYKNNPDSRQFWPIWQVIVDGSNGQLTNEGF